jgi:hypothetical protein
VVWESRAWNHGDYPTGNTFALTNPHNIAPRIFHLRSQEKEKAIICDSADGPRFGGLCSDITFRNQCTKESMNSTTGFGSTSANDIALPHDRVFRGSSRFTVKEIEVFELKDWNSTEEDPLF